MDAQDVKSFFENVCGECAFNQVQDYEAGRWVSPELRVKFINAVASGVQDLSGWYGDELHSDKSFMSDMLGDHVFGAEDEVSIVEELSEDPHYKAWAEDFLHRHNSRLYPDMSGEGVDRASLCRS